MDEEKNNSKIRWYERPEFILLMLTGLLWTMFLFKILFLNEEQVDVVSEVEKNNFQPAVQPNPNDNKPVIKQRKSRNNANRIDQQEIEALRATFEKENPNINNYIIRPVAPNKVNKQSSQDLDSVINNTFELNRLNAEYQRALKDQ